MGVAPGGLIKQCILEDTHPASIWERDRTVCFNVQILNSEMFQQVTGKGPPSTPISAKTYADQGLPFYKIYGETSTIKGDFDGIKSVKELDKVKNKNGKRENEGDKGFEPKKKAKDFSDKGDKDHTDEQDNSGNSDGKEDDSLNDDKADSNKDSDKDEGANSNKDDSPIDNNNEEEQPFQNPIILLNPDGSATSKFTPVSELMEQLSSMKLRNSDSKLHATKG